MTKLFSISLLIVSFLFGACNGGVGELDSRFNYLKDLKPGLTMNGVEALFSSHTFFFAGNSSEMKYDLDEKELHQNIIVQYNEEGKAIDIQITIDFSKHKNQTEASFEQIKKMYASIYEIAKENESAVVLSGNETNVEINKSSDKIEIRIN